LAPHRGSSVIERPRPCSSPGAHQHVPPICPRRPLEFPDRELLPPATRLRARRLQPPLQPFPRLRFQGSWTLRLVFLPPQSTRSQNLHLRLLCRVANSGASHVPSTIVASCGVASVAWATVSACGRGVDSSTPADRPASPAVALGSSPSHDRSVDFLHNTIPMIIQARLLVYTNYSEIGYTHKLDRTTVTVGAQVCWQYQRVQPSQVLLLRHRLLLAPRLQQSRKVLTSLLTMTAACRQQPLAVPSPAQLLQWWGLDCGSSHSLLPPCPRFLLPLGPQGRTTKYPATTQDSTVSI
jgi:hypothetical protein